MWLSASWCCFIGFSISPSKQTWTCVIIVCFCLNIAKKEKTCFWFTWFLLLLTTKIVHYKIFCHFWGKTWVSKKREDVKSNTGDLLYDARRPVWCIIKHVEPIFTIQLILYNSWQHHRYMLLRKITSFLNAHVSLWANLHSYIQNSPLLSLWWLQRRPII